MLSFLLLMGLLIISIYILKRLVVGYINFIIIPSPIYQLIRRFNKLPALIFAFFHKGPILKNERKFLEGILLIWKIFEIFWWSAIIIVLLSCRPYGDGYMIKKNVFAKNESVLVKTDKNWEFATISDRNLKTNEYWLTLDKNKKEIYSRGSKINQYIEKRPSDLETIILSAKSYLIYRKDKLVYVFTDK